MSSYDYFDDLETEDFALIGDIIGYAEEEASGIKRIEQEAETQDQRDKTDIEDLIP